MNIQQQNNDLRIMSISELNHFCLIHDLLIIVANGKLKGFLKETYK